MNISIMRGNHLSLFFTLLQTLLLFVFVLDRNYWQKIEYYIVVIFTVLISITMFIFLKGLRSSYKQKRLLLTNYPELKSGFSCADYQDHHLKLFVHGHHLISHHRKLRVIDLQNISDLAFYAYKSSGRAIVYYYFLTYQLNERKKQLPIYDQSPKEYLFVADHLKSLNYYLRNSFPRLNISGLEKREL